MKDMVEAKTQEMKVLYMEPGCKPQIKTIIDDLHTEQELVDGLIEPVYFEDGAIVVVNEEGKINGMDPCCDLTHNGEIIDVLCGPVFVCCADDDGGFTSLSDSLIARYTEMLNNHEIEF